MEARDVLQEICWHLDEYNYGRFSMYEAMEGKMTLHEFIDKFIDHPKKEWMQEKIKPFYDRGDYSIDRVAVHG